MFFEHQVISLLKNHSYQYFKYTNKFADDCINIHKKWLETRQDMQWELDSTYRLIENFDVLNMQGCILYADDVPAAFSFGERLGGTALIHFEKSCIEDGMYQLINREFIRNEYADTCYINRAEDMGIEGLKKAKKSYHPAFMIDKYDCTLKE